MTSTKMIDRRSVKRDGAFSGTIMRIRLVALDRSRAFFQGQPSGFLRTRISIADQLEEMQCLREDDLPCKESEDFVGCIDPIFYDGHYKDK
jgi:hypothetical protein